MTENKDRLVTVSIGTIGAAMYCVRRWAGTETETYKELLAAISTPPVKQDAMRECGCKCSDN